MNTETETPTTPTEPGLFYDDGCTCTVDEIDRRVLFRQADCPVHPVTMPAVEAFAHAIAMQAQQHAGVVGEDEPAKPARLPFPRPPFDEDKAWREIAEKRSTIRGLEIECLRADAAKKSATDAAKGAHEDLSSANVQLGTMLDNFNEERAAKDDPVQIPLPGRQPCAWEREHPNDICGICSAGGAHVEPIDATTEALTTSWLRRQPAEVASTNGQPSEPEPARQIRKRKARK